MTNTQYQEELKYLEQYDISEEEKIKFIENLYRLANINFNNFIKNN
jgi:hypothetical protein